ncbi:MAG: ATP-binding cassette domain-containing protein [Methylococcaceae bacterium]|nr:ATP-binding cassette domain-containing protein [Methylococcaceae bacterium]MCI0666841.1 ATP-binding cassette domain-containing protein [Methylococcaceae bacterium]MCI0733940.1 ATP-binding cassette domain-containing protein [Methylococcaceae bacterium]
MEGCTASDRSPARIKVADLTLAYGEQIIQRDLSFSIRQGEIFIIMGGSGCGKTTLLKHLIGLLRPNRGKIFYDDRSFWDTPDAERDEIIRRTGILYQSGALWSSLTLAENVALPLAEYTNLTRDAIDEIVSMKLALVGLAGFEDYYPSEISGGMQKRAGLARAMALDPEILFFDEPSAGLDPVSAKRLDDLIVELKESLGTTIVVVTHELASILTIGTDSVFLDNESKTMIAGGHPRKLLNESKDPRIRTFLTRGGGSLD